MLPGNRGRLIGEDGPPPIPVLPLDLRACVPCRRRADCAAAADRVVEQGARPVGAVELGLVNRRARRPGAGVERDRRRRARLRLDVADDLLEGALQRIGAVAEEGRRIPAAEGRHLVERGDRARVRKCVAHADDVRLDVIGAARERDRAKCRQLIEDVALRLAVGPDAAAQRVLPLRRRVLAAVGLSGRIAVRRQHHEIALAALRDRRARAAEVVLDRAQGTGDRRVESAVLDLAGAAIGFVGEQSHQGREVGRRVSAHSFVDVAATRDVVAVAPTAPDPELAWRRCDRRQEPGVGRREVPGPLTAAEVSRCPAGRVVVRRVDVVACPGGTDAVELVLGGTRVENVVDVGVVAAAVIGDVAESIGGLRIGDAAKASIRGRDAVDTVVRVDHRRRVAQVVGVRVVQRRTAGAEAGQPEVECIAIRGEQAAQDAPRDVAARVRVVAADHLACHRRIHRLGVVEDDHDVWLDSRGEEERIARQCEWRRGEGRGRCAKQQCGKSARECSDRLHRDLVSVSRRWTGERPPSRVAHRQRAP